MNEGGGVDQFKNHREIEVTGVDIAGGAAGEEGEGRAETFAAALASVGDVGLDGGIERAGLLGDAFLDAVELGVDEFEGLFDVPGRIAFGCAKIPGEFHKGRVSAGFPESQWWQPLGEKPKKRSRMRLRFFSFLRP